MNFFFEYKSEIKSVLFSYGIRVILMGWATIGGGGMVSYGQEQPSLRTRAEQHFQKMEYANAIQIYERLLDTKKPKVTEMERLADSYFYLKDYELASNWYARVYQLDGLSEASYWSFAQTLQRLGKYDEVKKVYKSYLVKYGTNSKLENLIAGADSASLWMETPTYHKIYNEQEINTGFSEFGLYPIEAGAIFVRELDHTSGSRGVLNESSFFRIYSASRNEDGSLSYPNMLQDDFNRSRYHIGPAIFDPTGEILYVTRTYPGSDVQKYKAKGWLWKKQNLELKIYRKIGTDWHEEDFAYNNVKEYSVGHAALNKDGTLLYFASDMDGGFGGVDIWYCEKQEDNSWGAPKNVGSEVNTEGDELFPTIHDNILYYSSDGHVGMGGLDIFYSIGQRADWTKASNVRYPLNSSGDDFSLVVAQKDEGEEIGYLSSDREFGKGLDDIYSYRYLKPKVSILLEALSKDKSTGNLLPESRVTLFFAENEIVSRGYTDEKALISFELEAGKEYRLLAEKKGYFPDSLLLTSVIPSKDTLIRIALNLQPVYEKGTKFVLENIYYDFDKYTIRTDAGKILDKLVATMRDNPTLKIELSSHTDSRGSNSYNRKLSQNRAQSAVDYMVGRGIARDRMIARGYGETRLVNGCSDGVRCTIQQHQANRRTEIEILEY